jgi:hypothetical protein
MRYLKRLLSPSAAIALLALVIAMGGAAIALPGHNTVFSDDIVNGQVRTSDIKNGTVKAIDMRHRTLTIYEDEASGTLATNGSGIGAVDGWNGFLEYDNSALTGSPVGQNDGMCVRTAASGYNYECTWTFRLTGGDITVSGSLNDHDLFNLAVVGGTGKFAGATGTMHASFDGGSNVYTNTLHFTTL